MSFPSDSVAACTEAVAADAGSSFGCRADSCTVAAADRMVAASALGLVPWAVASYYFAEEAGQRHFVEAYQDDSAEDNFAGSSGVAYSPSDEVERIAAGYCSLVGILVADLAACTVAAAAAAAAEDKNSWAALASC